MTADNFKRDRGVLKALAERGDVGVIPRPVRIWIYGRKSELEIVAERLRSSWGKLTPENAQENWLLFGEREQSVTDDEVASMVGEIEAAIAGTEAHFDGWETAVKRSN